MRDVIAADDAHLLLTTERGFVVLDREDGGRRHEETGGGRVLWARMVDGEVVYGWRASPGDGGARRITPSGEVLWETADQAYPVGLAGTVLALASEPGPDDAVRLVGQDLTTGDTRWSRTVQDVWRRTDDEDYLGLRTPDTVIAAQLPGEEGFSAIDVATGTVLGDLPTTGYPYVDGDAVVSDRSAPGADEPVCDVRLTHGIEEVPIDWAGGVPADCTVRSAEDGIAWVLGSDGGEGPRIPIALDLATGSTHAFPESTLAADAVPSDLGRAGRRVQLRSGDRLHYLDGATGRTTWAQDGVDSWIDDAAPDGFLSLDGPTWRERWIGGADESDPVQVLRRPDGETLARVHERGRLWMTSVPLPGPEAVVILDDDVLLLRAR